MRIQLLSDLHFEFHRDGGRALAAACHAPEADVLVLAGDIAVAAGIGPALEIFSALYPHVLYVHGNHEFYGSTRDAVVAHTREACARLSNVHWLDACVAQIGNRRFVGTPLWFRQTEASARYKQYLNDFKQIADYEAWVYGEYERGRSFLEQEVRPGDIVISHHLPAAACVLPEYREHPLNCYFLADMEPLIAAKRPALWLHGHTHGSVDIVCGETRILCNPFGYVRREENRGFKERLVVEV
jgi:hypothetical protein